MESGVQAAESGDYEIGRHQTSDSGNRVSTERNDRDLIDVSDSQGNIRADDRNPIADVDGQSIGAISVEVGYDRGGAICAGTAISKISDEGGDSCIADDQLA